MPVWGIEKLLGVAVDQCFLILDLCWNHWGALRILVPEFHLLHPSSQNSDLAGFCYGLCMEIVQRSPNYSNVQLSLRISAIVWCYKAEKKENKTYFP